MKRTMAIMVSVMVMLSMVTGYYVEAATNPQPLIKVKKVNYEELESNDTYELVVTIENIGNSRAVDGSLRLVIPEDAPLTVTDQLIYKEISVLSATKETTLTYGIKVDSGAEPGIYELGLEGTYYDNEYSAYTAEDSFRVEVVEGKNDAYLEMSVDQEHTMVAGEINEVSVTITNVGEGDAWVLRPKFVNTELMYVVEEEEAYLSTLQSGESYEVTYEVMIDESVSGYEAFDIDVEYSTQQSDLTKRLSGYADVKEQETGNIIIGSISKSATTIYPDGKVNFDVTITNEGLVVAEDIKIEVSQDEALVPASQSIILIDTLEAGASKVVSFTMEATDSAISQNYPVQFTLTYNEATLSQYSGVNISNDDDEDEEDESTKPRIIITDFALSEEKIFVGDTFDINFNVNNTSNLRNVRNVKVVLETTEGVFLPLNQSNSYFISTLAMGGVENVSIPMKVFANAQGTSYPLEIRFEYEDYDGNLYEDSETITIPVYEMTELTVSDVRLGDTLANGYTLEVDFYNTGKVDITNMMVDIEGDFNTSNSNYYVGDFTTGRTDIYDVEIMGVLPETIEGKIIFTYDDTFGEEETYEKDFSLSTQSMGASGADAAALRDQRPTGDFEAGDFQPQQQSGIRQQNSDTTGALSLIKSPTFIYSAVGLVLVIVVVLIFIIIRRKRRVE